MTSTPAADPPVDGTARDLTVANLSCPREIVRFHLVYAGTLRASGNKPKPEDARDIRDAFHPQLEYLWQTRTALKRLRSTARVPKNPDARLLGDDHASPFYTLPDYLKNLPNDYVDLCEPVTQNGCTHIPLVRRSLELSCSLDILFLRQEDPGQLVMQGGDIDNRIKTLFDALTMPKPENEMQYRQAQQTTYSLLESDALISSFNVSTGRLLFPRSTKPCEVHLVVEVSINVLHLGIWNLCLLGD